MEHRRLGRTGHESSVAILGGAAFALSTPDEAARGFEQALAAGVNHLDIAPQYGVAEDVVGPLIPAVRDRLFVGCKTLRKAPDGVRDQLETSLRKLGCDQFDLYQAHAVTDLDVLDERADAIEVMLRARDEALTRFVGITGHDLGAPRAHLAALQRWDLDTVMFPVYPRVWADPQYRADAEALLAECAARDVGVMAIKAVAWRPWGDQTPTQTTWYQPFADQVSVERGVRFTLSTPGVHAFCTPGDTDVLTLALRAANNFSPMAPDEHERALTSMRDEEVIFPLAEKAFR
jgi:aryl-alcohol dehydrogenase-like predicted oxidoreductase